MNKEITIRGKRISYRVFGVGKPVMMVHGFGETGDVWARLNFFDGGTLVSAQSKHTKESKKKENIELSGSQIPPFGDGATKFKFIIPDLPGSGNSEMIDDMSMEGMAEVLKIIFDEEHKQPDSEIPAVIALRGTKQATKQAGREAVLIGHSMGGYITLAFAEKYGSYLTAFGLFHSTAFADTEEKKATRRKGIEFIQQHGAFEFLKTSTPNLFSPHTKESSPKLVNDFIQSLVNFKSESLIAYYEAMIARPDRTSVLKNSKVPVLFVMGEHDIAAPVQDVLKQCHLPSTSFIHILSRSGHLGMLEESDKSNHLLTEFLENI